MNIDQVLREAATEEVFLAESGWFTNPSPDQLRDTYATFEREFEKLVPVFAARLGQPDFTEESAPELREELYLEARRLVGWKHGEKYMLLVLGQHDQETPVFVSIGLRGM